MFPLPFQQSIVSPASKESLRLFKATTGVILTCSPLVCNFEKFVKKAMKSGLENQIAICNIDGNFTNDL